LHQLTGDGGNGYGRKNLEEFDLRLRQRGKQGGEWGVAEKIVSKMAAIRRDDGTSKTEIREEGEFNFHGKR